MRLLSDSIVPLGRLRLGMPLSLAIGEEKCNLLTGLDGLDFN